MKPSNFLDSTVALTTSVVQVLPVNQNRSALLLYNSGTTYIYVGFSTDKLIGIPPQDGIKFNSIVPINAVYANSASTGTLVIWEA